MPHTLSSPASITSPFALFAFLLERLGETEPTTRVDAKAHQRFCKALNRICALDGDTLPASSFLHGLYLEEASHAAAATVRCGVALLGELRSHRGAIGADDFDARITIESLVVGTLQAWMSDPDDDPLLQVDFSDDRMMIRSRGALVRRYGVRIDVNMDADCLG